ncbi:MAG: hypothetical protein J7647_07835 [Cyanobacteria bacterium SBLK]|nr:hypothetical protein [Cyanobacteria bacterium SBLK]
MTNIKTRNSQNGSSKQLEKQVSADRYIAVSDLMALLSDLSNDEPISRNPQKPRVIQPSQLPLASLPQSKSPTSQRSLPLSSAPFPTLPASSSHRDRAVLDVEATNVEAANVEATEINAPALSPTQPEEKTIEELARELWELKLVALSDNDYYNRQLSRLQNRFLWLAGVFAGTLLTSGITFGWLVANLRQSQIQLANYEGGITINRVRLDRLEGNTLDSFEATLRSLQDQIPETLDTDLENTQEDITALKVQLREMELKLAAHDKALSVLVSALQGIVR